MKSFVAEFRDAIAPRAVGLVLATLLLQLGFIASYVGAFHDPTPHALVVGVVGPSQVQGDVVDRLSAMDGDAVDPQAVSSREEAVAQVEDGSVVAALVIDASSSTDELLVASGGGASQVTAVEQAAQKLSSDQGRTFTTTDAVPLEDGDARGLSGFYATIGWLIGGYLMAALLGVAKGARPVNPRRAAVRLVAQIPYAVASGLGGALILDPWLGALTGHFWALWGLGSLLVLAAGTVTTALQVLFGPLGVGLAVLIFVVLGNPSAGGAFQWSLLPGFWRAIGPWLPNGAGTAAARDIVYFGGNDVAPYVGVILAYAVIGVALTMAASLRLAKNEAPTT